MPRKMARTPQGATAGSTALPAPPAAAPVQRKISTVITLLRHVEGATLADLIGATGWLAHTTRAALTGLKRKGHAIAKTKVDGLTCYRIVEID